jgi:uncharacterized protein
MKQDARSGAPAVNSHELDARRSQRLRTAEALRVGRTPLQVIEVAAGAAGAAEEAVRQARERERPRRPSACREGCAWCCYQVVGTAAPEVFRILSHLRATLSPEDLQSLRERVTRLAGQRRALAPSARERAVLPCALLVADRCSAYPVRPLTCRGYNSSDASACERALRPGGRTAVPVYLPQQRLTTFVLDGLRAGLQEARLDGELLELTAALHVALEVPDAEARWLAGEAVFAPARLP